VPRSRWVVMEGKEIIWFQMEEQLLTDWRASTYQSGLCIILSCTEVTVNLPNSLLRVKSVAMGQGFGKLSCRPGGNSRLWSTLCDLEHVTPKEARIFYVPGHVKICADEEATWDGLCTLIALTLNRDTMVTHLPTAIYHELHQKSMSILLHILWSSVNL